MKRHAAALIVAGLALAACGDDDESAASGDDAPPIAEIITDAGPVDAPTATVAPDLPDAYEPAVGPVEVSGDPLPAIPDPGRPDAAIGTIAPTVLGLSPDGEPVRIDPAATGPTMVVFLAHWCGHCNDEVPEINELGAEGRFPEDMRVVGVTTASDPNSPNFPPGEWLDDKEWLFDSMLDGVDTEGQSWIAASAYGVTGFPSVVVLDGDGAVVDRWSGARGAGEISTAVNVALG